MARSIKEIKKTITDAFMSDMTIREQYGITGDASFEDTFSSVSIENILFYIIASSIYVLEGLFDLFKKDVDERVATSIPATIPWYHGVCLEYQHGDTLEYDSVKQEYRYAVSDEGKRLVKFAACRDSGSGILILVSGEDEEGRPEALSNDVLTPFREYLNLRKPAGIPVSVYSYPADEIIVNLSIQYDPLVLSPEGSLLSDTSVFPVEEAVTQYLHGIVYGGVFNKTKLIDAIQLAPGVTDVVLLSVQAKAATDTQMTTVSGNNYTATSGAFTSSNLKNSISYVLQL